MSESFGKVNYGGRRPDVGHTRETREPGVRSVLRGIKKELRVLGIDDAPFKRKGVGDTLLVGCIFRAGAWCDGVLSRTIAVDGTDATARIVEMVRETRHRDQLRVLMLNGITVGGMNVIDINQIFEKTKLPAIVVTRKRPNYENMRVAVDKFEDSEERWALIEKAGEMQEIPVGEKKLFIQTAGISTEEAAKIVALCCTHANYPEALRVAHLIARGVTWGESRGRA